MKRRVIITQLRHNNHTSKKQDPCQSSEGTVPLVCLKEKGKAVMAHTTGDLAVVRRLSEMGLTPGCELRLLRKCGFRGPIEIEVRGVSLALGYDLASEILVQPLEG
jgi:Fe2+ transport system protein FeoA